VEAAMKLQKEQALEERKLLRLIRSVGDLLKIIRK
jgi:hypothetical protein